MLVTTAIITRVYPKVTCSPCPLAPHLPSCEIKISWKIKSWNDTSRDVIESKMKNESVLIFLKHWPYPLSPLLSSQRSWMAVCMLTATSSCATQTPSIGKTLSKTPGSIRWWCLPTAASHVSYQSKSSISAGERWQSGIYQYILFAHWAWVFLYLAQS